MTSSRARCRLCNEDIIFTIGNPVELGFHMIDRHASGSVMQYTINDEDKICPVRRENGGKCSGGCVLQPSHGDAAVITGVVSRPGSRVGSGKDDVSRCKARPQSVKYCSKGNKYKRKRRGRGLYKTTLETWTAGGCYMICPGCHKEVKPLIKTQKNKVAYTSLGATFLLSCWPFCFLFPLQHKCSVDLYCPCCKTKLGIYDTATGNYQPYENVVMKNDIPNIRR